MSDSTPPPRGPHAPDDVSSLPFTRVYQSTTSGFGEPAELVVGSPAEWQRAWLAAHPNRAATLPPAPPVDFGSELIVLVSPGPQPTGGMSLRIDAVRARADGGADVVYTVVRPGAGCVSTQQITAPVDVVRLARRSGAVRFVRHDRSAPC